MANLEKRNDRYRIIFRLNGEKFSKTLGTTDQSEAEMWLAKANHRINQIKLGNLAVPKDTDLVDFVLELTEPIAKQTKKAKAKSKKKKSVTIAKAWEAFNDAIPEDSLEKSTLKGMKTHIEHLARLIGRKVKLKDVDKLTLQTYVDKRSKEQGRYNRSVSVQTIKKELRTFSTVWNWMIEKKLVRHSFPNRKLRYPKFHEKPPFQTWQQIESRIRRSKLSIHEKRELWDSLFLDVRQIQEILEFVNNNSKFNVFYPMLFFAACTGARRSEIRHSQLDDLDFESSTITIREKKRVRGQWSTRRVPMQNELKAVLLNWLEHHPGTNFTFASYRVGIEGPTAITDDQASNFFESTFRNSKWHVLHGWHIFRHSFCSNCAAAGVEQRIINEWVGHQTAEMVRRYRHLFPNHEQDAIDSVFQTVELAI